MIVKDLFDLEKCSLTKAVIVTILYATVLLLPCVLFVALLDDVPTMISTAVFMVVLLIANHFDAEKEVSGFAGMALLFAFSALITHNFEMALSITCGLAMASLLRSMLPLIILHLVSSVLLGNPVAFGIDGYMNSNDRWVPLFKKIMPKKLLEALTEK